MIPFGTRLARIRHGEFDPLQFGSNAGNRFDDPNEIYGVCYPAMNHEGAFAGTCLREVDARLLIQSYVQARSFSEIGVTAPLRLASLHGPGLAGVCATSAVASGSRAESRIWSRALHDDPATPDGIAYRSKHDDEICIALFDRARDRIAPKSAPQPMMMNPCRLVELCTRYDIGLKLDRTSG